MNKIENMKFLAPIYLQNLIIKKQCVDPYASNPILLFSEIIRTFQLFRKKNDIF